MNQTLAVWLLIALALVSANLPFLTERVFAVLPWKQGGAVAVKPFWMRLVVVLVVYALWEFYAITLSLYLVLAYPGFVYRYLFKRHPRLRV
jgi:hypothetical protein